ncbi:hypothetical protein [Spirosoma pollinicola]|uniref:Lipocalin-like domain-containing protein n=1 Tax=Spirosoma pollinicola TaxID=2057025 RepID=A0A2K8ZA10_9BACT|nr:hypothetical protein [Spirosoma pollinicola]AUD06669.1 hypothetical protein CWM47_35375 [Spirosoma pollinicola]
MTKYIGTKLYQIALLVLLMVGCQPKFRVTEVDLKGAWKTDSIYSYTNGFVETKTVPKNSDEIIYEYDGFGTMTMRKEAEARPVRYQIINGDSMQYVGKTGTVLSSYRILHFEPGKLVLRKMNKPLFSGKNQLVYEIRRFSLAR